MINAGQTERREGPALTAAAAAPHDDGVAGHLAALVGERYDVLGLIGEGPVGLVCRARDRATRQEVALKLLAIDPDEALPAYEGARQAERIAEAVAHPRAVVPRVADPVGSTVFYTTPHFPGGSVEGVLASRSPLPFDRILAVLRDAAEVLDRAHERRIVHGGLKPSNLLFDAEGRVHVSDFGVVSIFGARGTRSQVNDAYVAPEQWRGQRVSGQADQYALAIIAYELITGQRRADARNVEGIAVLEPLEVSAFGPLRPELGMHVNAALGRAMSAGTANRFATVGEFVAALAGAAGAEAPQRGARAPLLRKDLVVAAGVVALLAGAFALALDSGLVDRLARSAQSVGAEMSDAGFPELSVPSASRVVPSRLPEVPRVPRPTFGGAPAPSASPAPGSAPRGTAARDAGTRAGAGVSTDPYYSSTGTRGASTSGAPTGTSGRSGATAGGAGAAVGANRGRAGGATAGGTTAAAAATSAVPGTGLLDRAGQWLTGVVNRVRGTPEVSLTSAQSPPTPARAPGSAVPASAPTAPERAPTAPERAPAAGLRKAAGYLHVSAVGGAPVVLIDGVPRGTAPLTVRVAPGSHRVEVRSVGARYTPERRHVGVADRDTLTLQFLRVSTRP